jgi:hypothetical protein
MNLSVSYDIELDVGDPADLSVFPDLVVELPCPLQPGLILPFLLFPDHRVEC